MIGQVNWDRKLAALLAGLRGRFWILWILTAGLVVFAVTGIARIQFNDELLRFFQSDLPAYQDFSALSEDFVSDSDDIIALIEAPDLADPKMAEALSNFILDVQFIDGVQAVISPMSLHVTVGEGEAEPLFPYPPLPAEQMQARLDAAYGSDPALQRMMSDDREAMIAVLPISESDDANITKRREQIDALAELGGKVEASVPGAQVRFAGYPILRDAIAQALMRDVIMLIIVGTAMGFTVAVLAFRSFRLALLALPGPMAAVAITLALHGHLGVSVNTMTINLPVLILVLATSDAIHIGFERARQGGRDTIRATVRAVRRVATACIFAAFTTAIAFGSLGFSRSTIIAEMGWMGVVVTLASVVVVLLTQTVVLSIAGRFAWFTPLFERLHDRPPTGFGIAKLPHLAFRAPRRVAWGGIVLMIVSAVLYYQAVPRYSLMDGLRKSDPVRMTFEAVEAKVTPVSQFQLPVTTNDPKVIEQVRADIAEVMGEPDPVDMTPGGESNLQLADLPEALARRVVSRDGTKTLVSTPFEYVNGDQTIAVARAIDAKLAEDPALEGVEIGRTTGLPVMSSRVASVVLDEINRSLLVALGAVALLILIWLRNLKIALISLVPNMLPVTLVGAWLAVSGGGIDFSNGMALTVAFGIAVDDTLHVLNRLHLSGGVGRIKRRRLLAVFDEVSPALITTSVLLVFGMLGTLFAQNEGVAIFGRITIMVYILALIADLLVLPAILIIFRRRVRFGRAAVKKNGKTQS
ncbi:MAG: MMPL family transporter [Maritimibacter sp.]